MRSHSGNLTKCKKIALVVLCATSRIAAAQDDSEAAKPISIEPALLVELRYDENIFRSARDVTSSLISIVSPRLDVVARPSNQRFEFSYRGDIAWYRESEVDDYDDHFFEGGAYLSLGQRANFDLVATLDEAHENRGTGLSEGFDPSLNIPPKPDEYRRQRLLGRFSFGNDESVGRLVVDAVASDLGYTNNRDRTRFYDRIDTYGNATFYLRVLPGTSLMLDARVTDIDWQNDRPLEPGLDNTEYRFFVGITWDTSGAITGTLKGGIMEKDFVEPTRGDYSDPSWDAHIRWSPRSYSHFDFRSARLPSETNGFGSFIDNRVNSISWEHEWNSRIQSSLSVSDWRMDYRDSTIERQQDLTQYSLTLSYEMRRWLTLEAGVEVNSRESNIDIFGFDGNVYRISVLAGL